MVVLSSCFQNPSESSDITVNAGLYPKAVEVYYIPRPSGNTNNKNAFLSNFDEIYFRIL